MYRIEICMNVRCVCKNVIVSTIHIIIGVEYLPWITKKYWYRKAYISLEFDRESQPLSFHQHLWNYYQIIGSIYLEKFPTGHATSLTVVFFGQTIHVDYNSVWMKPFPILFNIIWSTSCSKNVIDSVKYNLIIVTIKTIRSILR